jgi:hypothetical protein
MVEHCTKVSVEISEPWDASSNRARLGGPPALGYSPAARGGAGYARLHPLRGSTTAHL